MTQKQQAEYRRLRREHPWMGARQALHGARQPEPPALAEKIPFCGTATITSLSGYRLKIRTATDEDPDLSYLSDRSLVPEVYSRMGYARHDAWLAVQRINAHDRERLKSYGQSWVMFGFEYTLLSPTGEVVEFDSCWGFDDAEYMAREIASQVESALETERYAQREYGTICAL